MKKTLFALMLGLSAAAAPVAALAQSPAADSRQAGYVQPLTAENSLLLLVDLQDMFGMTISSIDQTNLVNNAAGIAKAAKVFNVPTILASANAKSFAGPVFQQVTQARPDLQVYDRTAINVWQDRRVVDLIKQSGRKKIIIGGLWTASCVMLPALSALGEGYEVYILSDVTGDITPDSQNNAMQRLIQAGATPINWVALMLEWQQDWSRKATAGGVLQIARDHGAAWGMGASYAGAMKVGSEAKSAGESPPAAGFFSGTVITTAILWRLVAALQPVVPHHFRHPQPILRQHLATAARLRRPVLFEIAPLLHRRFVAPKRERQQARRIGQALKALDGNESVDLRQQRLQRRRQLQVGIALPIGGLQFKNHGDHYLLLSTVKLRYARRVRMAPLHRFQRPLINIQRIRPHSTKVR